jgi:hypothetical protein
VTRKLAAMAVTFVLAGGVACSSGGDDETTKAEPSTTTTTTTATTEPSRTLPTVPVPTVPVTPGALTVTLGDLVPFDPPQDWINRRVVNENHAPVAVTASVANGTDQPQQITFTLTTPAGLRYTGLWPLDVPVSGEFQPGESAEWQVAFTPLRSDSPPVRVEARNEAGDVVAQRNL